VLDRSNLAPHAIARWAASHPDRVAVEHVGGERLTYGEFHDACLRWAGAYRRLGVAPGDHVATMVPNSVTGFTAWFGLGWLRTTEVPLNIAYTGRMLQYALDFADVTTLVIAGEYVERLVPIAAELPQLKTVVIADGDASAGAGLPFRVLGVDEFLDGAAPATDAEGPLYRDICSILYTSGTTGPSKGVLSPWAMIYQMWSWVPDDGLLPGETLYCSFPMFHNSGKSALNSCLVRGGRFLFRDRFSATHFWDDVRAGGAVLATLVGPMTALMAATPEQPDDADNPLRAIVLGPMIPDMEAFERRFGVKIATCYGMTETGAPFNTTWDHGPWATCGKPRTDYPWSDVAIVNEFDEPVPVGEVGELLVRSREPWALNAGYYKMPDATAAAWRNGWFHTGDAFRCDGQGWYYYVDRMKDTIRRRGENISSFEVENFVLEHPDVADCAAVGVPARYGEDEVFVALVVRDPATFDPAGLIAFLEERMPRFMVPRYLEVMDDLPRNETSMRVKKFELRSRGVTDATWDREEAGRA
jgi:crotonobetaine/carnitine-CoA ligase